MSRKTGIQEDTLAKYREIAAQVEGGCKTAEAVSQATGYSRATVYRGLRHLGVRLARQPRRSTRPLDLKEPVFSLTPEWAAEFRGFFYGEGFVSIQNATQDWRPIMTINLRADDEAILRDIQCHLGGHIAFRERDGYGRHGHSQFRWTATGWGRVKAIIEQCGFLDGVLPAKKHREVKLVHEAILARCEMAYMLSEENRDTLRKFHSRVIKVRQFKYSG